MAAQMALADVPLKTFLVEHVVPYENDEVTRLIVDDHDAKAFAPVSHLTVGAFRDWLLSDTATEKSLAALAPGLTPEIVAAVSKICRVQDLVLISQKCRVVTKFRNTIGLKGRLSTRLQPNHPTDDPTGIAASIVDGLMYGNGDAVIGINPATDSIAAVTTLIEMLHEIIQRYNIPTQSCVLTHVTTQHRGHQSRRAGRPRFPVDCRDRSRQQELRHQLRHAARRPRGGARSSAWHGRQQRHVF